MKGIRILLAAALLAGSAVAANAQTISYAQAGALLAKSCGADINKLCANVNLGNGAWWTAWIPRFPRSRQVPGRLCHGQGLHRQAR